MNRDRWLDAKCADCWSLGVRHRERLLQQYLQGHRLRTRPLLREVVDDLIEEVQQARLRVDVLPLDRFAQTERVGDRIEVTMDGVTGFRYSGLRTSSRIARFPLLTASSM
jgi:hypothetical protein